MLRVRPGRGHVRVRPRSSRRSRSTVVATLEQGASDAPRLGRRHGPVDFRHAPSGCRVSRCMTSARAALPRHAMGESFAAGRSTDRACSTSRRAPTRPTRSGTRSPADADRERRRRDVPRAQKVLLPTAHRVPHARPTVPVQLLRRTALRRGAADRATTMAGRRQRKCSPRAAGRRACSRDRRRRRPEQWYADYTAFEEYGVQLRGGARSMGRQLSAYLQVCSSPTRCWRANGHDGPTPEDFSSELRSNQKRPVSEAPPASATLAVLTGLGRRAAVRCRAARCERVLRRGRPQERPVHAAHVPRGPAP